MKDPFQEDKTDQGPLLDIVARVAAALLAPHQVVGSCTTEHLEAAANLSVLLVEACQRRLEKSQEINQIKRLNAESKAARDRQVRELLAKYPGGVPWQKALKMITGMGAADAKLPYKLWCVFESFHLRNYSATPESIQSFLPGRCITEADTKGIDWRLHRELMGYQNDIDVRFNEWVDHGVSPIDVVDQRPKFRSWYRDVGISALRRESGKTGAAKKKELASPETEQK